MTATILPFPVPAAPAPAFHPGDRIRIRTRDWEEGDVNLAATVLAVSGDQLRVRIAGIADPFAVAAADCELETRSKHPWDAA
jgi:hypothetical protein